MSEPCGCRVEIISISDGIHFGIDSAERAERGQITYCSLHQAARLMQKTLESASKHFGAAGTLGTAHCPHGAMCKGKVILSDALTAVVKEKHNA